MNAYLSLWVDQKDASLEACSASCQESEVISRQIVELLAEAKCTEDKDMIQWCIEYLAKLRSLARQKINQVTLNILENIEKFLVRSEEEKAAVEKKSNF